jgi:hypothetical protein
MAEIDPPEANRAAAKPKKTVARRDNAAASLLTKKWTARHRKALAEAKTELEENQFFLHCPRIAEHHAAYLTEKPIGPIHPGMWFNVEHPEPGDPWFRDHIACQECLVEGEGRRWPVHLKPQRLPDGNVAFTLSAPEKYVVGRVKREKVEAKVVELTKDGDGNG